MSQEKQQLSTEKPPMAFHNKWHLTQLPKISQIDENLPYEDEAEEGFEKHTLSIKQTDISKKTLVQLLNKADMNKITHFSLDLTNQIGQELTIMLTNLLSQLTNLESFDLNIQQNGVDRAQFKELYLAFQALKKLKSLKFNSSKIIFEEGIKLFRKSNYSTFLYEKTDFQEIYQSLGSFPQLQELELIIGCNYLSKIEMNALTKTLNSLQLLTSFILNIRHATIESPGIETLTTAISKLTLLETLELTFINCNLDNSQRTCIFLCVPPLVNLKHLTIALDINELGKQQVLIMTKKFRNFKQLYSINFGFQFSIPILLEDPFEQLNETEYDEELFNGDFEELIKQSCLKNARHLVHYEMVKLKFM